MSDQPNTLTIDLLSDSTFGRGEGTPGVVDIEVEHDAFGLPFLGGKTLRGLLRDTWLSMQTHFPELHNAARRVYGPTRDLEEVSLLRVGDAVIEEPARGYFIAACQREQHRLAPELILSALTDIRFQTSEERSTGAPARTTLRSIRVVLRGLRLTAPLLWLAEPDQDDMRCLALAALGTRHAGQARNRGRGHISIAFNGDRARTRQFARRER
jgi:hypothetical protein